MSIAVRMGLFACIALFALLVGLCFQGAAQADLRDAFVAIWRAPWGKATLVDLYIGLLFVAVWIATVERSRAAAACWIAALLCLGNLVTLVYLIRRAVQQRSWTAWITGSDAATLGETSRKF